MTAPVGTRPADLTQARDWTTIADDAYVAADSKTQGGVVNGVVGTTAKVLLKDVVADGVFNATKNTDTIIDVSQMAGGASPRLSAVIDTLNTGLSAKLTLSYLNGANITGAPSTPPTSLADRRRDTSTSPATIYWVKPDANPASFQVSDWVPLVQAGELVSTAIQTGAYTAASWDRVPVNNASGGASGTLPATAAVGDVVEWIDVAATGAWAAHPFVVNRNGRNINGLASNFSSSKDGARLVCVLGPAGWTISEIPRSVLSPGPNEVHQLATKATPVAGDLLMIEDGADSYKKKAIDIANLPSSGGGTAPSTITKFGNGPSGANIYYSANFVGIANPTAISTQFICYYFGFLVSVATKTWSNVGVYVGTFVSTNIEVAMYNIDWTGTNPKPGTRIGSAVNLLPTGVGAKIGAWSNSLAPGWYLGRMIFDNTGIAVRGPAAAGLVNPLWGYDGATTPTGVYGFTKNLGSQVTAPSTGEDITDGSWAKATNGTAAPSFYLS